MSMQILLFKLFVRLSGCIRRIGVDVTKGEDISSFTVKPPKAESRGLSKSNYYQRTIIVS